MKTSTSGCRGWLASQAALPSTSADLSLMRDANIRLMVEPITASVSIMTNRTPTAKSSEIAGAGSVESQRQNM